MLHWERLIGPHTVINGLMRERGGERCFCSVALLRLFEQDLANGSFLLKATHSRKWVTAASNSSFN